MVLVDEKELREMIELAYVKGQTDMRKAGGFRAISKTESDQYWVFEVKPRLNIVDTLKCSACNSETPI